MTDAGTFKNRESRDLAASLAAFMRRWGTSCDHPNPSSRQADHPPSPNSFLPSRRRPQLSNMLMLSSLWFPPARASSVRFSSFPLGVMPPPAVAAAKRSPLKLHHPHEQV